MTLIVFAASREISLLSKVANNDDIVEAVSRGVATAVAQVLNSGGRKNNGGFVLNVNGKEFVRAIYSDMQSVTSERGISLVNA